MRRKSSPRPFGFAVAVLVGSVALASPTRSDAAGEIYWFSLLTEDPGAASEFYSGLFGWEIAPSPTGALMAVRDGVPFAGISQIEDRVPSASEAMWLAAITVADLERSVAAAKELGGTVHEEIGRLEGWGSYALVQDPQGAPLSLVDPERALGGTSGFGGWRWAELWTHEPAAATEFYKSVIGYEREDLLAGDEHYSVFASAGKRNAGLILLEQREIASRWMPYVGVSDLRAILVRVWQLEGKVLREPAELDFQVAGQNRVALIADPTGGAIFLYQLDEKASADPIVVTESTAAHAVRRDHERDRSDDRTGPNINFTVSYGYGFGPGWGGGLYPPYRGWGYVPY
jgi:predicted enzyme related to lactoylglutathione lyase